MLKKLKKSKYTDYYDYKDCKVSIKMLDAFTSLLPSMVEAADEVFQIIDNDFCQECKCIKSDCECRKQKNTWGFLYEREYDGIGDWNY